MGTLFGTTVIYDCDSAHLDSVQYKAARLVTGAVNVASGYTRNVLESLLVAEGHYTF